MKRVVGWLLIGFSTVLLAARADTVTVAVASNFTAPMSDIAAAFERETGHEVRLAFGSSGKIVAQIRQGAPFDAFFSADQAKPEALQTLGLAVPDSRFTYAIGALALWSSRPDLPLEGAGVLRQGDYHKLALANPRLAPYGEAAVEVLDGLALTESTRPHWVQGENIAQTYQFVRTGNATLGFVALSQIMTEGDVRSGSVWIVPDDLHSPIRQDAVLLRRGEDNDGARAFMDYMRGEDARAIIHDYGYTTQASP